MRQEVDGEESGEGRAGGAVGEEIPAELGEDAATTTASEAATVPVLLGTGFLATGAGRTTGASNGSAPALIIGRGDVDCLTPSIGEPSTSEGGASCGADGC